MKNTTVNEAVSEAIQSEVDKALYAIKYNLTNAINGLLYSITLENNKQPGGVGDIDNLIRIIISTSHYDGPDCEEYPAYDEKAAYPIITRLTHTLQVNGIEQAWNIGRNKIHGPKSKSDELADALEKVLESLENWMEIADKGDAREYDQEAVEAAKKALERVGRKVL